jgi:hypothetical protein
VLELEPGDSSTAVPSTVAARGRRAASTGIVPGLAPAQLVILDRRAPRLEVLAPAAGGAVMTDAVQRPIRVVVADDSVGLAATR